MRPVRIELPFPPPGLNPNRKSHYMVKAKIVREYREAVAWSAVASACANSWNMRPLEPPVRAAVTFVVPTRHKRDEDNLLAMLKPAWDGLVDAGVLAGDDSERFSVESCEIEVDRHRECRKFAGGIDHTACSEPKVIVVLRSL